MVERALRARGNQHVEQDLPQQLTGAAAPFLGRGSIRHRDGAAAEDGHRHLGKQSARINAGQPAEIAARCAVDAHRYHGGAGLGGDEGATVIDLHQRAGLGDAAFRKDHDGLAGFHQLDDLLDRQRTGRIDGQVRHKAEQKAEQRLGDYLAMHDEHRLDRHEQSEQQAVEEGFVVGHDQRAWVAKYLGVAAHIDTEHQFEEKAEDGSCHDCSRGAVANGPHI